MAANDDYANDASYSGTAYPGYLSTWSPSGGTIEQAYDEDWFNVYPCIPGATVTISVDGDTLTNPVLDLYRKNWSTGGTDEWVAYSDDVNGYDPQISFVPEDGYSYYAAVAGKGTRTGAYTVAMTSSDDSGSDSNHAHLSVGPFWGSTGTVEQAYDEDWIYLNAVPGATTTISVDGDTLTNPVLDLYEYNWDTGVTEWVAYSDDVNGYDPAITFVPAYGHYTYYAAVAGKGTRTGTYTVAETSSDDAGSDADHVWQWVYDSYATSGTLEQAYDRDWFGVSASVGDETTVSVDGGTLTDPTLELYRRNWSTGVTEWVAYNDDTNGNDPAITFVAEDGYNYYASVAGYGSLTGTYTVSTGNASAGQYLYGSDGADVIYGTSGADTVYGYGGNDQVNGGSGDDYLEGHDGTDVIYGEDGIDTIWGGSDRDELWGGSGADYFVFASWESGITRSTADVIYDFTSEDFLLFNWWDANPATSAWDAWEYRGTGNFSSDATGELRFIRSSHALVGSTDRDAQPEFAIVLSGISSLSADQLIL